MKQVSRLSLLVLCLAQPALAGLGDTPPINPCSTSKFTTKLAVLGASGDGNPCVNGVNAETIVTCISKEKTKPVDIAVEYFDAGGTQISAPLSIGNNTFCGLTDGQGRTFGNNLGIGFTGFFVTPPAIAVTASSTSLCPTGAGTAGCFANGSIRILATGKVQCSATRIDYNRTLCAMPSVVSAAATKNLTIIKLPGQKGD